jgi:hypothetical protein
MPSTKKKTKKPKKNIASEQAVLDNLQNLVENMRELQRWQGRLLDEANQTLKKLAASQE